MRSLVVFLGLTGCFGAAPCLDQCEEDGAFWEACWGAFADAEIAVTCYDDPAALGEALAEAGDGDARWEVYAQWTDEGKTHDCETPDAVVADCRARTTQEFRFMDADAREERVDECTTEDEGAAAEAMRNNDCEGFLTAIGF